MQEKYTSYLVGESIKYGEVSVIIRRSPYEVHMKFL